MYFKILRTHHWLKNLLIFLPVFAAGLFSVDYLILGLPGFFIFSLTASSIYIFNDVIDIKKDKKHPKLKNNPYLLGLSFISFPLTQLELRKSDMLYQ